MDYIRKLPLLMALSGAIITGLVGYTHQVNNNENMINMLIAMVIFYLVGLLIRGTVLDIIETNRKKEEEERIKEEERIAKEKEKEEKKLKKQNAEKGSGSTLDIIADEDLDLGMTEGEFNALPVADYITNELKK